MAPLGSMSMDSCLDTFNVHEKLTMMVILVSISGYEGLGRYKGHVLVPASSLGGGHIISIGLTETRSLIHWIFVLDVENFLDSLDDEDDCNEGGKVLLSEPGNVTDDKAGICCNHDQEDDTNPNSNPHSKGQIIPFLTPNQNRINYCSLI